MTIVEKILKYVKVNESTGCWEWQRCRSLPAGYGFVSWKGKPNRLVHRVMYEEVKGPLNGLWVLHRCDNPCCCNPDHLFLGTPQDNQTDSVNKGRRPRNETHPLVKLTNEQVAEIRANYRPAQSGKRGQPGSQRGLAERYGVSRQQIQNILYGKQRTL